MLNVANLDFYYGESHTLWDLALEIPSGSCTCLMGRNGVGKTTLLKNIMGLLKPKNGVIEFDGEDLTNRPPELRAAKGIGYVPQGREIFPLLSVEENLRTGLIARSDGQRRIPEIVFDCFPGLKEMLDRRGGDLSGGQQQQLAIGRALVIDPKFGILDEPTEGIQPNIVQFIGDTIEMLNQELGLTVLLVEQKLYFAQRLADRFAIMEKGRIIANGALSDLTDELVKKSLSV